MTSDRLTRQIRFMVELDKVKRIVRRTELMDRSRFENDAEHSWHMSIMAGWLCEYATPRAPGSPPLDVLKVIKMCLIHDVVEIDAGDTYAYDPAAQAGKADREQAAADRIFGLLPDDQAQNMRSLWNEFEARHTPEAKFAAALDRVQGVINNYQAGGGSWQAHAVTTAQVRQRIAPVQEGAPALWEYLNTLVDQATKNGWLL